MSRLTMILATAVALLFATVASAQTPTSLINYQCSDSACSASCQVIQTLPIGTCFGVAHGIFAIIKTPDAGATSVTTLQFSDPYCANTLVATTTDAIGSSASCKQGAGSSFYLDLSYTTLATPASHLHRPIKHLQTLSHKKASNKGKTPVLPQYERHNVFFRFTPDTTPSQVEQIDDMYRNIANQSPYVVSIEGGTPNSREGFQQQMDIAYLTTFSSVQDRDFFVGRPFNYPYDIHHDAFKAFVGPHLYLPIQQGLVVVDFFDA